MTRIDHTNIHTFVRKSSKYKLYFLKDMHNIEYFFPDNFNAEARTYKIQF
jgi:hypothetical protein